jgi:hypothetical protein
MIRLLTRYLAEIPGITPLPIPDYLDVYSCWMVGFNIDANAFRCDTESFATQVAAGGIPGAGIGNYYLMPEGLPFLNENAQAKLYPYSMPPASREYCYGETTCPRAHEFLKTFIRWSTFCEKYQPEHCEIAAQIIFEVAEQNHV